ncbi:S1C family serine protease [Ornithinicoccus halotolerans]|uniref:S1C family serine protease n=1 Tax=Ornithinicoccus halotolerans TaxID=1748220 RepID=UPI001E52C890|nr:trypsin-like peptidase domain-containing protein [Ornithinicoccus halotolerans]
MTYPMQPHSAPPPARDRRPGWGALLAVGLLSAALATAGTAGVVQLADDDAPIVTETATDGAAQPETAAPSAANASLADSVDWGQVADQVTPSSVAITVGSGSGQGGGAGSGVIWDGEGHVVTNAHVVAGADQVRVTLSDGRGYQADVVGTDVATDLAVLQLAEGPDDLTPVQVGDDQELGVGAPVMAVGNPLGLSGTVTTGIVSALDRPVTTQSVGPGAAGGQPVVTNAIQTSAPINPGNSGGALVDASGRLVGINSSIASLSQGAGGQAGNIGIGFAIPVGVAESVVGQLLEDGTVEHAFVGVGLADAEAEADGAVISAAGVTQVEEGSPAETAGLQRGDVITAIDGERVDSAVALVAQVRARTAGEEAVLSYLRDGEEQEATVTLDTRPDEQ